MVAHRRCSMLGDDLRGHEGPETGALSLVEAGHHIGLDGREGPGRVHPLVQTRDTTGSRPELIEPGSRPPSLR